MDRPPYNVHEGLLPEVVATAKPDEDVGGVAVVVEHDEPGVEAGSGLDDADLEVGVNDQLLRHEAVDGGVPGEQRGRRKGRRRFDRSMNYDRYVQFSAI